MFSFDEREYFEADERREGRPGRLRPAGHRAPAASSGRPRPDPATVSDPPRTLTPVYDQVAQNKRRSYVLILAFVGLVLAVGCAVDLLLGGGPVFVIVALVLAEGRRSLLLEVRLDRPAVSRAKPGRSVEEYGRLHNLVEGLCIAGGLPKPRLYVVDDPSPNAFATGRNPKHAAIAVTTGLLEKMNRVELEGVLAHELSHIKNYDILVSTLAVTMVGVIALLADIGIRFMWFGGAQPQQQRHGGGGGAITRHHRVRPADPVAAHRPGHAGGASAAAARPRRRVRGGAHPVPPGLISALEKLRDDYTVVGSTSHATAHLWIEQPQAHEEDGRISRINRLFDTHPPLEERIALLREL